MKKSQVLLFSLFTVIFFSFIIKEPINTNKDINPISNLIPEGTDLREFEVYTSKNYKSCECHTEQLYKKRFLSDGKSIGVKRGKLYGYLLADENYICECEKYNGSIDTVHISTDCNQSGSCRCELTTQSKLKKALCSIKIFSKKCKKKVVCTDITL